MSTGFRTNMTERESVRRKMTVMITVMSLLFVLSASAQHMSSGDGRWSVRMADADIARNPEAWMLDFSKAPKWNYTHGLMCSALERLWKTTGDRKYYDYIKDYADDMINDDGSIRTYKPLEYNIDRVNAGKFLFALYHETKEEKYRIAIDSLRAQMRTHPRTSEGVFWHKKIYPHQIWLDGLYMASPFLAQYAKEFNEPALFDDVAKQFVVTDKHLFDKKSGLYRHGWDESKEQRWSDKETGLSPHVWGRAMGWYAMAVVDVLDYIPNDHQSRKEIIDIANKLAKGIAKYQDKETGLWYQVVDQGNREGNYLEASASSMFSYFLVKAAKKGYIPERYKAVAKKGYDGLLTHLIKTGEDDSVHITNVCAVAGLGGKPYRDGSYEYYVSEEKRDNDPKAVGPFIMLALEFEQ